MGSCVSCFNFEKSTISRYENGVKHPEFSHNDRWRPPAYNPAYYDEKTDYRAP